MAEAAREARIKIKHRLIGYMKNLHSLHKAFVTYEDVSRAWSGGDQIEDVLYKTSLSPLDIDTINQQLLRFLSILVYIDAHDFLDGPRSNFFHNDGELIYNDEYLPAHGDGIPPIKSFARRKRFLNEQYLFLPEIIEESSRIRTIGDERRLPFDHIYGVHDFTYGAYGTVDGVGISPGYFTISDNQEVELVAYKRFHAANPHADSARLLQDIGILKESIKGDVSIRTHLATLLHRGEHLVLLPWMDNLDLDDLLVGGYDFSVRDVAGFATPISTATKSALAHDICVQMYRIADALAWLHEGIVRPENKGKVYFVHMDLKPNSILIDRETSSDASMVGAWALTDFGISAFRDDDGSTPSELTTIRDVYERSTVQMTPRRETSAYQPPEAQLASRRRSKNTASSNERHAGREADIWSFACIFSEALTFALGQASAVREFRAYRTRRHEHDYFYEAVDSKGSQQNDEDCAYKVRDEVLQWPQQLKVDRTFSHGVIDCCVMTVLQTLVTDVSHRPKAKELVSKMDHVRRHMKNANTLDLPEDCPLNKLYSNLERSFPASPSQTNDSGSAMRQDSHTKGLVMPQPESSRKEDALKSHDSPESRSLESLEQNQYRSGMDSEARENQGLSFERREPSMLASSPESTRGDSAPVLTNNEDIKSGSGSRTRSANELHAVRLLGDIFAKWSELQPQYEAVITCLGPRRFVKSYRKILKLHLLRLRHSSESHTLAERIAMRILQSQQNREDIAISVLEAFHPKEEDTISFNNLSLNRTGRLGVPQWIRDLELSEAQENDEDERIDLMNQSAEESGKEIEHGSVSEHDDDLHSISLTEIDEINRFLRSEQIVLEVELHLLVLPLSIRGVLDSVPKKYMSITRDNDRSFLNRLQAIIEDNTVIEWDWWPLRPRMLDLATGKNRLEWQVAGRTYSEELTPLESIAMQGVLDRTSDHPPKCCYCAAKTPQPGLSGFVMNSMEILIITFHIIILWMGVELHLPWSRQPVASKARQRYTPPLPTASTAAIGTSPNPAQRMTTQTPSNLGSSGTTVQMQTGVPNQTSGTSLPATLWVIFGVSSGSEFVDIENIEMSNALMSDPAFFQELRRLENTYRWPFLRWFSPFIFTYCNFVQFETMNTDRVFCCGESLPEDHGHAAHYEYHPRPPRVKNPPITKNEFRTYLNTCEPFCFWSYVPLLKHRCATPHRDSHKWRRIPRKKAEYDTKTGTPGEYAFGIEAVYVLSFPTVFAYHTLSILAWSGFWVWWLREHPNDLQNASIPTMVFMGIIASFWVLPGRGNRV